MSGTPFHLTRQGARYYEHTLPELARAINRLAQSLERLAELHVQNGDQQQRREPEPKENDRGEELHATDRRAADR